MINALIRLVLLPLRLLRRLIWRPIWFVGWFVLWRPRMFVILLAVTVVAVALFYKKDDTPDLPPKPAAKAGKTEGKPVTPPTPTAVENGNSVFAENLLGKMKKEELMFYSKHFHTAMINGKAGQAYNWSTPDAGMFGTLTPYATYRTDGGVTCRNFDELLSLHGRAQRLSGIGCERRSQKGWCKLRQGNVPSCELKSPGSWSGTISNMKRKLQRLF